MIESKDITQINQTLLSIDAQIRSSNDRLKFLNDRQEDILHLIEFENMTNKELTKIAKELRDVRRERREIKNYIQRLDPISEWISLNQTSFNRFSQAIGKMRGIEKAQNEAVYMMRAPGDIKVIEHAK